MRYTQNEILLVKLKNLVSRQKKAKLGTYKSVGNISKYTPKVKVIFSKDK
jgi:hypothetical protein